MALLKRSRKGEGGEMEHGRKAEQVPVRRAPTAEEQWRPEKFWSEWEKDPWAMFRGGLLPSLWSGRPTMAEWPAMDMAEVDKAMTIRIDVPGMEAKDVQIEVSGNLLTLHGERTDEWSDNSGNVQRRERRSGSFSRTITLPSYVEADKIDARYDKGVLTVTIPKNPGKGPRKVQVTT